MAAETQYTANTGLATVSVKNTSLNGSGTLVDILLGAANGTLIKTVTVKALSTTISPGMIRLFVYDGTNTRLLEEIEVIPGIQASINPTFEATVNLNLSLQSGYYLRASTEENESFNIIVESSNWAYYASSVRDDTTQYSADMGIASISTANSNLDGTGTVTTILTAGSSATYKGCSIPTITIKGTVNTTPGMVRLFIGDTGSTKKLFKEIVIPSITKTATDQAFEHTIVFEDDFDLQAGYKIIASTQNAENFNILVEGKNWNYKA
ncbi:MAG: hypothetical protein Q8M29_16360 [Bacteroidota bacterium]|nr:hypothetical protein [Bacteroidota bacterium]